MPAQHTPAGESMGPERVSASIEEALAVQPSPTDGTGSIASVIKEVLQIIVPAIFMALTIHIFLAQATVVYGQSMQPNLMPAQRLVIEKVSYYLHPPQHNDIVVLDLPQMQDLLIKRVVALPGETVEIRNGQLLVDGRPAAQDFAYIESDLSYGPLTLRPMTYFVLGDNRINSNDSRAFGPVSRQSIVGKAWLRYWPLPSFTIFD